MMRPVARCARCGRGLHLDTDDGWYVLEPVQDARVAGYTYSSRIYRCGRDAHEPESLPPEAAGIPAAPAPQRRLTAAELAERRRNGL